jgi:hypothetical protein
MYLIQLDATTYGVYARGRRGPYGTPLMFKGTLDACLTYRKENHDRWS